MVLLKTGKDHDSDRGGPVSRRTKTVVFQKVLFFDYFRHDKSEPHFTDDCILYSVFDLSPKSVSPQNGTTLALWKSVTAILHRISVSIFEMFCKSEIHGARISEFSDFRPSYYQ